MDTYGKNIPLNEVIRIRYQRMMNNRCPNCGKPITKFWFTSDKPWCVECGFWFTISGGHVINNPGSEAEYNRIFREENDSMVWA